MFEVIKQWYRRSFEDPQAAVLMLFILFILTVFIVLGQILKPVFVSIVLAYLLDGLVSQLGRWKVPHTLSVISVYLLFLAVGTIAVVGLLPLLWEQLTAFFQELPTMVSRGQQLLQHLPEMMPDLISTTQIEQWSNSIYSSLGTFGKYALSISLTSVSSLINAIVYLILVPFLIYFLLMDKYELTDWLDQYAPRNRGLITKVWQDINMQFASYIRGRVVQILLGIAVNYAVFVYFGLQYAMLLSVAVGVSVVIPYIGAILATFPVLLVAILQWGWTDDFVYLAIAYGIVSLLTSFVLEPLLFSEALALHPIAIIVATLIFGSWFGFWGIFFAIPLASIVKAVLNAWPRVSATKS